MNACGKHHSIYDVLDLQLWCRICKVVQVCRLEPFVEYIEPIHSMSIARICPFFWRFSLLDYWYIMTNLLLYSSDQSISSMSRLCFCSSEMLGNENPSFRNATADNIVRFCWLLIWDPCKMMSVINWELNLNKPFSMQKNTKFQLITMEWIARNVMHCKCTPLLNQLQLKVWIDFVLVNERVKADQI